MPNLDLSQNLLSTETSYQASDWGSVGGSASLDLKADAELKRGINLGLGVSALAQLDASFRKFVAADAQAHAEASAGITAQIQVPLDIFKEAGGAIRLEAAAQAAVGIEARLGLSIGDFLALAEKDPHMQGVPLKLLRIFLEELDIQGGIKVKAAFSAMAYAKLAMTGRLIGDNAGFTVEGEYGMGLEGGAGFRYFANLGFTDPRRLIRRTVDVLVDELITELEPQLPDDQSRSLLRELRVPAKMVFRSSFELGLKLAENVDSFNLNTGVELAQHVLVVLIEEAQRFILQLLIELATDSFRWALTELGTDEAVWDAASDQRETLATLLENMPPDAFDATEEDNLIYWGNVINGCINLASALGGSALISQAWVEPVAVIWSATQLLFESAKRVSSASARVSMIGVGNAGIDASFPSTTAVTIEAPAIIRDFINNELERNATDTLNLNHLVDFLIRDVFMEALREQFPEFAPFMNIIGGQNDVGTVAAARSLFSDVGAFAPAADGTPDPQAALRAFSDALKAYLKARIGKELVPVLHQAIDNDPDLKLYVDEVFFSTLDFTINVIFEQLLGWSSGNVTYKTALREVCSGIVMRLVGRSLVVTADILSTAALAQTSDIFKDVANHVDDNGGIADQLSSLVNLEREMMAEIMEETLLIAADVFDPLPDSTRRHIRNLLYEMIETIPPGTDATFLDQLADDFFIPNFDTVQALAGELGTIILKNMEAFLTRVLQRIAEIVLEEIGEIIDDIKEQIEAWVNEIEQLAADIQQKLLELAQEIIDITNEIADYMHNTSEMVVTLLGQLNSSTARSEMRQEVRTFVLEKATEALNLLPGYTLLPGQSRKIVRKSLSTAIGSLLNNAIFDDFMAA
ncbi:MAG: hypothetical protein GY805_16355, partial [Chloroflexi bacterium]|nr:hypothetical protein [Chloroflexota bacterium]